MKKTLIALMALAGAASAEPTEYAVTFADNKTTTLSSQRSHIIFGDTQAGEDPLTLTSWMIEFSMPSFPDKGVIMVVSPSAADKSAGFGIRTQGGDNLGILFGDNNNNFSTPDTEEGEIFVDASKVTAEKPLTIRFAYDAESDLAYLYDATNNKLITHSIDSVAGLSSVAADHNGDDVNGKTQFYTQGNGFTFNLGKVYDMGEVAGNNSAFEAFVTKPIPEPTTTTLSLLALCGLAARRRRH